MVLHEIDVSEKSNADRPPPPSNKNMLRSGAMHRWHGWHWWHVVGTALLAPAQSINIPYSQLAT